MRTVWVLSISLIFVSTLKADDLPVSPEKVQAAAEAEKAGAYAAAEALLNEVVRDAEKLGENDPRFAQALERLGIYYVAERHRQLDTARSLLEQALAIREKANGADSPDAARDLVSIALTYLIGKADKIDTGRAWPLLDRARKIYEKSGNPDDPGLARVLHTEAVGLMVQSKFDEAEPKLNQALRITEHAFGPEDTETADLLKELGILHMAQAKAPLDFELMLSRIKEEIPPGPSEAEKKAARHGEQARECFERALKIREKALGPDDRKVADVLLMFGSLAMIRERMADAEEPLKRWLEIFEAKKWPVDEEAALALLVHAASALDRGDLDEAEKRFVHAYDVFETAEKPNPEFLDAALSCRLDIALKQERYDKAETLVERSLAGLEDQIDLDDPAVQRARELLAQSNLKKNRDNADAPLLWNEMTKLAESHRSTRPEGFWDLLKTQAKLLRLTNQVVPRVTQEDLDYLKKIGAIMDFVTLDFATEDPFSIRDPNNALDDAGLAHARGFANLQALSSYSPGLTDAGLRHLTGLKSLKKLGLFGTGITSRGLETLQSLPRLEELNLDYTRVDDSAIETLARFPALKELKILHTRITPEGEEKLRLLRPSLIVEYEEGYQEFEPPSPEEKKRFLVPIEEEGPHKLLSPEERKHLLESIEEQKRLIEEQRRLLKSIVAEGKHKLLSPEDQKRILEFIDAEPSKEGRPRPTVLPPVPEPGNALPIRGPRLIEPPPNLDSIPAPKPPSPTLPPL